MSDFNTWWGNVNIYRNLVKDPLTGSFTDSITTQATLSAGISITNVLCNGGTTGTASLTVTGGNAPYVIVWDGGINPAALASGAYSVTITDANSLVVVRAFTVTEPDALVLTPTTVADTGGGVGTATADTTGGVAPYTYDWRDNVGVSIGQATRTATALTSATYQVFVTDANGCIISNLAVIVA